MKRLKRKDLLLLTNKLIEKVPDRRNAKEHYESFLSKKNKKSVKQSEKLLIKQKLLKTCCSSTVAIKSVTAEHPKNLHKLSKTS